MPRAHFPSAPSTPLTADAWRALLRAKSPAAALAPDLPEPSDALRLSATAAPAAIPDILRGTPRMPTNDPATRASACPSRLHPDMARTTASPGGTAVFLSSLCPCSQRQSWHHLDPSTPSSNPRPRALFRRSQP